MSFKNKIKLLLPRYQKLILEYKVNLMPRSVNSMLYALIDKGRGDYALEINKMLELQHVFHSIKKTPQESDENLPAWNNGFLPGLDIVALYTFIRTKEPGLYIEIGSGNSTKVARKAVKDGNLSTKIVSIDPYPRAQIDHLADEVIRLPFEKVKDVKELARRFRAGDILFIDNSHRVLPNSDATVCFLELIPQLEPGVIVHIHDIYLPYDYPQDMCDRFYSEQYMLAMMLLANPEKYKVLFPCFFVSQDKALSSELNPIWHHENSKGVEQHGGSFWFIIQ
jgi:hypothetical protein